MPEPNCSSLPGGEGGKRSRIRRSIFPKVSSPQNKNWPEQCLNVMSYLDGAGSTLPCFSPILASIWRCALPCTQVTFLSVHNKSSSPWNFREEEWQFPAQIMPVVRDTVAHAGFKITKVTATKPVHLIQKVCLPFDPLWNLDSRLNLTKL